MELLTVKSAKIDKTKKGGINNAILYLAPASISGKNVCPRSSAGCRAACLYSAGRGRFTAVQNARIQRTLLFHEDKAAFYTRLLSDLTKLPSGTAVRLNGTSDIDHYQWSKIIFGKPFYELLPELRFYEYTKRPEIAYRYKGSPLHVTFSRDEANWLTCVSLLEEGVNVAVVFLSVPETYKGYRVIDGDITDARFLDPDGVIVGLSAKGAAKKDTTGFVLNSK